jgi:hypothetical protein
MLQLLHAAVTQFLLQYCDHTLRSSVVILDEQHKQLVECVLVLKLFYLL